MSWWTVDRLSTAMSIVSRLSLDGVSIDLLIEYRSTLNRYSIKMPIESIDRQSIAHAFSTHDPSYLCLSNLWALEVTLSVWRLHSGFHPNLIPRVFIPLDQRLENESSGSNHFRQAP